MALLDSRNELVANALLIDARSEDDDRYLWVGLAKDVESLHPVQIWHLGVQRDHVRVDLRYLGDGDPAGWRRSHHLERWVAGEHVGQQAADDNRAVDNQDSHLAHRGYG
jgi:hypothetical protein